MLGEPNEIDVDETEAGALASVRARVDTLNLSNHTGKRIDEDALTDALGRARGAERITTVFVQPSSRMTDVRVVRAFPGLEALFVLGSRIRTLAGLELFRRGRYLKVSTGRNTTRDIGALPGAPVSRLTLQFGNPTDLVAIARSRTLRYVDMTNAPELDLPAWGKVPLEALSLWGGGITSLRDTDRVRTLRRLTFNGCRLLERFGGRCENIDWMIVEDCPRLEWSTLRHLSRLRYLAVKSRAPVSVGILGGLSELREASLLRAESAGVRDLARLAPKLEKLYAGGVRDSDARRLSMANPRIVIDTGRRTFVAGVEKKH